MDAVELVGLLGEPERVRVVAALVLGARTAAEVAEASGLESRAVAAALHRLLDGGLVEHEPGGYLVHTELFKGGGPSGGTGDVGRAAGIRRPEGRATRAHVRPGRPVGRVAGAARPPPGRPGTPGHELRARGALPGA